MVYKTSLLCPESNKHSIHLGSCVFTYIIGISLIAQCPGSYFSLCLKVIGVLLVPLIALSFCWRKLAPVVFCLAGMLVSLWHSLQIQDRWLSEALFGQTVELTGTVHGLPADLETLQRFNFRVDPEPGSNLSDIRLSWYGGPELETGDRWQLTVKLKPPLGNSSAGAFDLQAWAAREGIQASGYVRTGIWLGQGDGSVTVWRDRLRQSIGRHVKACLDSDVSGLLVALMIGDKSGISQDQWQWLNKTGTTHLLVISGLHIGLMASLGFWLALALGRLGALPLGVVPGPTFAAVFALLLALIYASLAGFTIPVQRALVMVGVALSGNLLGLKPRPSTLFLLALALVLTIDPLAFTSAGFWYSFAAVAVLLYGFVGRRGMNVHWQRWGHPQWVVFLLLFPLLQFNGQSVSLVSPLLNLVAIPLVAGLMVPMALLALLLSVFSLRLFHGLLQLLDQLMSYFVLTLQWFDQTAFDWLLVEHGSSRWWAVALAVLAVFLVLSPKALGLYRMAPVLLLPWLQPERRIPEPGLAKVAVLDVGQGLSVLVQTRSHTLLYDTGDAVRPHFSMAERVVIPYLEQSSVTCLDRVVISHGDRDHAGGLQVLQSSLCSDDVWAGSGMADYSGYVHACEPGQVWEWDQVRFEFLAGSGQWSLTNDRSCVLKITANGQSLLLTGDIGRQVEGSLLSQSVALQSDFLLLPHHGSKYSGSETFLQAVQPSVILISSGFLNRFGHPSSETLNRLSKLDAQVFNTAKHGTLEFVLGESDKVKTYRKQQHHYWQRPLL